MSMFECGEHVLHASYGPCAVLGVQADPLVGDCLTIAPMRWSSARVHIPVAKVSNARRSRLASTRSFMLSRFCGFGHPAAHRPGFLWNLDGVEQETVGGPANFIYFLAAGIEIDVQFGDFTPPRKRKVVPLTVVTYG